MQKILIISTANAVINSLTELLEYEQYNVLSAKSNDVAIDAIQNSTLNLIILHLINHGIDESFDLKQIKTTIDASSVPVLIIAKKIDKDFEKEIFEKGATGCVSIPINIPEILKKTHDIIEEFEPVIIEKETCEEDDMDALLIGSSKKIEKIKNMIRIVAPSNARVLITGENGTGKEIIAKCLHMLSARKDHPMIKLNCAAIPSELIESELFGHEKGAFTSAIKQYKGKFEQANNGTLFLDEIGDMSLAAQAKMLRVLQEGKLERVGGNTEISVNVRVISATNKVIKDEIKAGNFREDLYHRLSVIEIHLPRLDDRIEDLPELANYFIKHFCQYYKTEVKSIDSGAIDMLQANKWTGNVRELQNAIERLVIFSEANITEEMVDKYINNI